MYYYLLDYFLFCNKQKKQICLIHILNTECSGFSLYLNRRLHHTVHIVTQ